jgi:hypothetical protein
VSGSTSGGSGSGAPSSTAQDVSLASSFSLQSGYAIELSTLPATGTTQAAVNGAEAAVRAKGATVVGLINQSDYSIKPTPPAGDYIVYSGQYKTQAEAEQALAKLKRAFPKALVIAVNSTSGSGGAGAVLSSTNYGSFHSVVGIKPPSQTQLAAGAQATQKVASQINQSYVNSQKGLPNEISVP